MDNMIEYAMSYGVDIWPVENMYNVGQLIYVLRNAGDTVAADRIQEWKERIEYLVASEFHETPKPVLPQLSLWENVTQMTDNQWGVFICEHPLEATMNHSDNPTRFDCRDCGSVGVTWDEL